MSAPVNVADALFARAAEAPDRVAMHYPDGRDGYRAMTYCELAGEVDALARGLSSIGVTPGMRVAVMVKPGPEFFATMFALFRAGAVPVLIDPGIDRGALKQCLDEAAPEAFIGIPLAHAARIVLGWARRSVRIVVTVGPRVFWGGHRYRDLLSPLPPGEGAARSAAGEGSGEAKRGVDTRTLTPDPSPGGSGEQLAAILFTSGSTGVPKGVEYTHENFAAQVEMIRAAFDIRPGEIDLPTFAPFALFDPALGMTTVLPRIDFARPGRADPRVLVAAIERFGVTTMFGSPAVVGVLATHGARLPGLRRVISAGAPVRPDAVAALRALLDDGARIFTPYGATECLPVSVVDAREIEGVGAAGTARGEGILVGAPVPPNLVRVIAIDDGPIPNWRDAQEVGVGVVGEITVSGPSATTRYFRRDAATVLAKIAEDVGDSGAGGQGTRVVHRMGDLGYFDAGGRLWYVGRKSHRVVTTERTLYTEQVEGVYNTHAGIARSALVGIGPRGAQIPVVCIELAPGVPRGEFARIERELLALGAANPITNGISRFLLHSRFPVDIRHNAKIVRERLARWAAHRIGPA
ncbi:MAG TPA: fatty acid CoA ligase family protein [Candidatus Saccharimonadia bacterium]|nr:fatty acid CoA ligase family protein [Candidatus Saccharimonadia bacterium]